MYFSMVLFKYCTVLRALLISTLTAKAINTAMEQCLLVWCYPCGFSQPLRHTQASSTLKQPQSLSLFSSHFRYKHITHNITSNAHHHYPEHLTHRLQKCSGHSIIISSCRTPRCACAGVHVWPGCRCSEVYTGVPSSGGHRKPLQLDLAYIHNATV